jgi:aryl-alcohol dehydrogenase-like predicted oxidoreductase
MKVSRICLGCMTYGDTKWRAWTLNEEEARPYFKQALDKGINFFDTADVYSTGESERITGKALKDMAKREDVVIATKVHGDRCLADAARHRLCRPLPDPPVRP